MPALRDRSAPSSRSTQSQLLVTPRSSAKPDSKSFSIASSSANTPQTTTPTFTRPKREVQLAEGEFLVERILARSLNKGYGPNGEHEHQYLVRWEGYGPEEDTWEMKSNLMGGSEELMEAFDDEDHPFTILAVQGLNQPVYRVRYAFESTDVPPSPIAEEKWDTPAKIARRSGCGKDAVRDAIEEFIWKTKGYLGSRKRKASKLEYNDSPKKARVSINGKSKINYELIEILQYQRRKSTINSIKYCNIHRFLISYRVRDRQYQDWMTISMIEHRFGEEGKAAAYEWVPREIEPVVMTIESQYEEERKRNMRENMDLMMQLGL